MVEVASKQQAKHILVVVRTVSAKEGTLPMATSVSIQGVADKQVSFAVAVTELDMHSESTVQFTVETLDIKVRFINCLIVVALLVVHNLLTYFDYYSDKLINL